MPPFKNFLGTENMAKFRNLLFREDTPNITENPINSENVTIGLNYKIRSKPTCYREKSTYSVKFNYLQ